MQIQYKSSFNIVIIGGEGAGKTTFFNQLVSCKFRPEYYKTIGIETGIKEISIENFQYQLQIKIHLNILVLGYIRIREISNYKLRILQESAMLCDSL